MRHNKLILIFLFLLASCSTEMDSDLETAIKNGNISDSSSGLTGTLYTGDNETTGDNGTVGGNSEKIKAAAVSAGAAHTCALISGGKLQCWGRGRVLGDGSSQDKTTPVSVSDISTATSVSPGFDVTCAVLSEGTVKCWGNGSNGQLGYGKYGPVENPSIWSDYFEYSPVTVSNINNASAVSSGKQHTCALLSDGTIQCWGNGNKGELGNGSNTIQNIPVSVANIKNAIGISSGNYRTCALLDNGTIQCWGWGYNGQLGNGGSDDYNKPVSVSGIFNATEVSVGLNSHSCALLSDKTVKCWGYGENDKLGNGSSSDQTTPVNVRDISTAIGVSAGGNHTCVLLTDSTVKCWGNGEKGQLGNGGTSNSSSPVSVSGISSAVGISAGYNHTCALISEGRLKCWGDQGDGRLGNGNQTHCGFPPEGEEACKSTPIFVVGFGP